jgi:hypothetical protein
MKHKHHIIPKHAGGSDDPSNLIELTPLEHAEAHRLLYEQYGRWQDEVAWKGLSKIDENFDAVKEAISNGGKLGAEASNLRWKDPSEKEKQSMRMKEWASKRNRKTWNGKQYEVTYPNGTVEIVEGLRQWCLGKEFNSNTFANACLRGTKTKSGFSIKRIVVAEKHVVK